MLELAHSMTFTEEKIVTNSDSKSVYKMDVYEEFITWSALPPVGREGLGIQTQKDFISTYKLGVNTPGRWKRRPDFPDRVRSLRHEWGLEKTGAVLEGIYLSAMKGNASSQKLWLQYFCDFTTTKGSQTNKAEISPSDIRFLIEALPEPLKSKHRSHLLDLLNDASAVYEADPRNAIWEEVDRT